jgi:adenylate cyclase
MAPGAARPRLHLPLRLLPWLAAAVIATTPVWQSFEARLFDALLLLADLGPSAPIAIVGIDEPSFAELQRQWPWPRSLHAALVDVLAAEGAAVIGLDVVFAEPSAVPGADAALAAAITRAGNVVLAAEEKLEEDAHVARHLVVEPLPSLLAAGGVSGLVSIPVDRDSVVRRIPADPASFWRKVLEVHGRRTGGPAPGDVGPDARIRYTAADGAFRYASYYQALAPGRFLPPGFFRDRIVLVGLTVKASPEPTASAVDAFFTPLFGARGQLTSGVEIHAQIIASAMSGRHVRPAPLAAAVLLGLVVAAASIRVTAWQPLVGALRALAIWVVLVALAFALLRWADVWVPVLWVALGAGLLYLVEGSAAYVQAERQRRQIRRAFEHYVAPRIVEQILKDPARLVLGGERREITILFGDLAGFTTISEALPPEDVARVLNRCLTTVTRVIVRHEGTVDKFMGDGIMAFWGAPLEDPDHAMRACTAAQAIQVAMHELRRELAATPGAPGLDLRIGLNSGPAIVGNMGSDTLFDYTAIGDDVNLASRLEGANKRYGTRVMLGEATARRVEGRVLLRRVDRIRVKGKHQAVEVFTLETDAEVARLGDAAVAAYRAREWDEAERLCKEILALRSDDALAALHLEHVATCRATPPPDDWDGSVTLQEK